jgi:hypothetical protein
MDFIKKGPTVGKMLKLLSVKAGNMYTKQHQVSDIGD